MRSIIVIIIIIIIIIIDMMMMMMGMVVVVIYLKLSVLHSPESAGHSMAWSQAGLAN